MLQNSTLRTLLAISLGAILGALSRYYLSTEITHWLGQGFPYGTLLINLTGCFGMGFFTALSSEYLTLSPDLRLLITTGFLGAYTTFSSYELDTATLLKQSPLSDEWLYWISSPVLGLSSFYLGIALIELAKNLRRSP